MIGSFLGSNLLDESEGFFCLMPEKDQCSWNLMISGFAQGGLFDKSLEYFVKMHRENFVSDDYTYGSGFAASGGLRDQRMGTQIHGLLVKSWCLSDVYTESALLDMYSKCGNVISAQKVFEGMKERNVVSWNSLISCYEQNGPANKALKIFVKMMESGFVPDEMSLSSILSACASLCAIRAGKELHLKVVKIDRFRNDLVICNALVDMYAKCGKINEARWIFDRMTAKNVVSETSMVSGYARVASVGSARTLFIKMMEKNVVSWNALIAGYTQTGNNEEALGLFLQLKREAVWPTHYTFGNVLNACANLADLKLGRQAHTHVFKHGFLFRNGPDPDVFVGNSLIDMYMKCGAVLDGNQVFRRMVEKDHVSWNAMIVGHAQNGNANEALEFFHEMLISGEKPDHVTIIGVLSACSHAGLVEKGRQIFYSMTKEYGLEPSKDHYTCMVDLLGRAALLDEAKKLIQSMPMFPDTVVWGSLLGACKIHGNMDLGSFVAERLIELDPNNSGPYVLLSNMNAELGQWGEVKRVRKLMRQRGVVKQPGCSWIEIRSKIHTFMVKDKRHPRKKEIYAQLKILTEAMRLYGYVPDIGASCDDEDNTEGKYVEESDDRVIFAVA